MVMPVFGSPSPVTEPSGGHTHHHGTDEGSGPRPCFQRNSMANSRGKNPLACLNLCRHCYEGDVGPGPGQEDYPNQKGQRDANPHRSVNPVYVALVLRRK